MEKLSSLALVLAFSPMHALSPSHYLPPPLLPASCKGEPPCVVVPPPPKFKGRGKRALPSIFRAHAGNTHFHITDKDRPARLRIVPHTDFSFAAALFVSVVELNRLHPAGGCRESKTIVSFFMG